jgi:hypothetical protein
MSPILRLTALTTQAHTMPAPAPHLSTVVSLPQLRIECSSDVAVHRRANGDVLLMVGGLVGLREESRLLSPADAVTRLTADGVDRWKDAIEGRVLVVEVTADGTCRVVADRFGQRDLYCQPMPGGVMLATSLDLLPVSREGARPDAMAYAHAMTVYGFRPPKRHTFYEGVSRLGVDQIAVVRDGVLRMEARPFVPATPQPYTEQDLETYAEAMLEGIRARASETGNVVYLSSGWDSTAILACLVHLFGPSKIRAVTGRMVYAERSGVINQFEIDRAQKMADFYGIPLRVVDFDYRTTAPEQILEAQPALRAQQVSGITALNHWILAAEARRSGAAGEVCFAGEMSDGAHNLGFSQYATYFHPVVGFREFFDKMAGYLYTPSFLRRLQAGDHEQDPVYTLMRGRVGEATFDAVAPDGAGRVRQLIASCLLRGVRVPLWSIDNNRLLTARGRERFLDEIEGPYLAEAAAAATPETLYAWYLHLYNSFHWQGATVATIPITAEHFGLQTAMPYHDGRVQDFLAGMPDSWGRGLDLHPTKYPLKWMLANKVKYPMALQEGPHSYLYDVDSSFNHSAEALYGSSMRAYFTEQLRTGDFRQWFDHEVFDMAYLDAVVARYLSGTEVRGPEMNDLWALCVLTMTGRYGGR